MCFGLAWFEQILIWIIVVCAAVALLRLLVSFVLPKLGMSGEVFSFIISVVRIIIIAIVCIFAVILVFELFSCLWSIGGGLSLPRTH